MAYSELKLYSFEYPDVALIAASFDLSTTHFRAIEDDIWKRTALYLYGIFGSRLQEFNFPSV